MNGFNWNHTAVTSGSSVDVTVTASPCKPVTVTLFIRGVAVGSATVSDPPGTVTLAVPAGSQGANYEISVRCNGQSDSRVGTVG